MQSSIVSIPLPDSWAKFLSDREKLPSIVGPIPPITSYYPHASSPNCPNLHTILH